MVSSSSLVAGPRRHLRVGLRARAVIAAAPQRFWVAGVEAEVLTVLSVCPWLGESGARAYLSGVRGEVDLEINLALPVPVGRARTLDGLNRRAGPALGASRLGAWRAGEEVQVWGRSGDWWLLAAADGRWGWSSASYLQGL